MPPASRASSRASITLAYESMPPTPSGGRLARQLKRSVEAVMGDADVAESASTADDGSAAQHAIVPPQSPRRVPKKHKAAKEPLNWREAYMAIREMRKLRRAPVDDMGCERLADPDADPKVFRFQSLVSLMLSSQTKDAMTAAAMANLRANGCTPQSIAAMAPKNLDELIKMVGFHNRKTEYLQKTARILLDRYDSDIPSTLEGLLELPGVGPKMAFLALHTAWDKNEGVGVDVHVHRITNRLRWVNTLKDPRGPEATRMALEDWLPREYWREINHMLVGFGQVWTDS